MVDTRSRALISAGSSQSDRLPIVAGTAAIIALALFFRLYKLDTLLHWAFGDEMSFSLQGLYVLHGQQSGLFADSWAPGPSAYEYILAVFQNLFGISLRSGRLVSVVFGTLTVPLVALCAREMGISWPASLLAAGLLAVSHWAAHFSRMVLGTTVAAFFLLLAVYTMMLAFQRGRWWLFLLAGVACGVAEYWKVYNLVLGPVLFVWCTYLLTIHFRWVRDHLWMIGLFIASCILTDIPLLQHWLNNADQFLNDEHHVGVLYNLSYWSATHPGESTTIWSVLWYQVRLGLGMFVINGGPYSPWGGTYAPAMDIVTGWLLFVAVPFALYRWLQPLTTLIFICLFTTWFAGVVMTIDAPQMEHAVGALPAIFLLIAALADEVGMLIARFTNPTLIYPSLCGLLLLVSAGFNYNAYFQVWAPQLAGSNGFSWQFYDAASYVGSHSTPHGTAIYSWPYPDEFFLFLAPHAGEFAANAKVFRRASLYIIMVGDGVSPALVAAHVPKARLEVVHDVDGDIAFTAVVPPSP